MKLKTVRKLNKCISITSVTVALMICVSLALSGFLFAKYTKDLNFSGNVTISANLAKNFSLYEHKAVADNKGVYSLTAQKVESNEYMVLPGVSIPKDPTVKIEKKTNIKAYLYLEVVDGLAGSGITYSLEDHWKSLDGANATSTGGKIYVYSVENTPFVFDGTTANYDIGVIKGDVLQVANNAKPSAALNLAFYAYLVQIDDTNLNAGNKTTAARNVFNNNRT